MPNTYTQIHIHAVFAVSKRECLIDKQWKNDLYKYITGIIQYYGHKVLQINGMPDHIHILFGMRPTQSISELLQNVKQDSSRWINANNLVHGRFSWQSGFGAFSYAKSDLPNVMRYIENQEEHHKKVSFKDEYLKLLKDFEIDFDEHYVFQDIS